MKVAIIGLPASGKSTLCSIMASMFRCLHVNVNVMLTRHWAEFGRFRANRIYTLVRKAVKNSDRFLLDGFPNSIVQYKSLLSLSFKLDAVVYIHTPDVNELVRRLHDRDDDGYDSKLLFSSNVNTFYNHTTDLIKYLKKEGKLETVQGGFSTSRVLGDTVLRLSNRGLLMPDEYVYRVTRRMGEEKDG